MESKHPTNTHSKIVQNPRAEQMRFEKMIKTIDFDAIDHIYQLRSEIKNFEDRIYLIEKAQNINAKFFVHDCIGDRYTCFGCEILWCERCIRIIQKKINIVERTMLREALSRAKKDALFEPKILRHIGRFLNSRRIGGLEFMDD